MSRQEAMQQLWRRLFVVLCLFLAISTAVLLLGRAERVAILVFLIGNIGSYISVHRSLGELKYDEVVGLASSWWAIVVPSVVGGVLALALYLLFMSNILVGDLFPRFEKDSDAPMGLDSIIAQHGVDMVAYAKIFFWSFVAGFNQRYVVDIINSVKAKP